MQDRADEGPRAFRPVEVARKLSLSERSVRSLIASGELRSVKIGAARLIPAAELERLLAK